MARCGRPGPRPEALLATGTQGQPLLPGNSAETPVNLLFAWCHRLLRAGFPQGGVVEVEKGGAD